MKRIWWDFVMLRKIALLLYKNLLAKGITESLVASKAKWASTRQWKYFPQLFFDVINEAQSSINGQPTKVWIYWLCHFAKYGVEYHLIVGQILEYEARRPDQKRYRGIHPLMRSIR